MPRGCQKTNETVNDTATQQVPDKYPTSSKPPHHPKQKYLLTEKGKERLEREDGKLFTK